MPMSAEKQLFLWATNWINPELGTCLAKELKIQKANTQTKLQQGGAVAANALERCLFLGHRGLPGRRDELVAAMKTLAINDPECAAAAYADLGEVLGKLAAQTGAPAPSAPSEGEDEKHHDVAYDVGEPDEFKDHPDYGLPIAPIRHAEMSEELCEKVNTVLAVVTETELNAVLRHLKPLHDGGGLLEVRGPKNHSFVIGLYGTTVAALVQQLGQGNSKSQAAISEALDMWKPERVIMLGIAFGLKPRREAERDGQRLGDVMVATHVLDYENAKLKGDGSVQERGSRTEVGRSVYNDFTRASVSKQWTFETMGGKPSKILRGQILSGLKLMDNDDAVRALAKRYQNYPIGGEMEGQGVAEACADHKFANFIVVKGICDFGGIIKKNDHAQEFAAAAAASLAVAALSN